MGNLLVARKPLGAVEAERMRLAVAASNHVILTLIIDTLSASVAQRTAGSRRRLILSSIVPA